MRTEFTDEDKLNNWRDRLKLEIERQHKGPVDIRIVPETLAFFIRKIDEARAERDQLKVQNGD